MTTNTHAILFYVFENVADQIEIDTNHWYNLSEIEINFNKFNL
jgi:hypothetical protein